MGVLRSANAIPLQHMSSRSAGSTLTNPCAHELSEEVGSRTSKSPPPFKTPVLTEHAAEGEEPLVPTALASRPWANAIAV